MSEPIRQFGRIPSGPVFSGGLVGLRESDAKVLIVLAVHADQQGRCMVGVRRIAKLTGYLAGTVSDAIKRLESSGLLSVNRRGNGRSSVYTLADGPCDEPPDRSAHAERLPAPGVQRTPNGKDARPFSAHTPNRSAHAPQTVQRTPNVTEEQNKTEQVAGKPAAAADDSDRKNQAIAELARAGVGDPARSQLASIPTVTARMVKRIRDATPGAGPGLIVQQVRATIEREEQRGMDKAERDQRDRDREQARTDALADLEREHEQDAEANRDAAEAWWAGLDEQKRRHWGNAGIPSPHPARSVMGGENIGGCPEAGTTPTLRYLAWARWHEVTAWREGAA